MDSFKRFGEEKLLDRECFYSSVKDGTTGDNGKKTDGHISDEDYLTYKKTWNDKYRWLSRSLFKKRCSVINWCFQKVYWHVLKILGAWYLSLFQFSWIKLRCHVKNDWCKFSKNIWHWHVLIRLNILIHYMYYTMIIY